MRANEETGISDIDRTDLRILDILQRDASLSAAQVAEKVGVTAPTAWRRITRLEKSGIIMGRHASIDSSRVGFGLVAYVRVKLVSGTREYLTNFLLRVVAKDTAAYDACFVDVLSRLPGLLNTDSAIVLSTIKSTRLLPLGTVPRHASLTRGGG